MTNAKKIGLGGSWLLLTLLMIGMSWSAAVSPATDDVNTPSSSDEAETAQDDVLALPENDMSPLGATLGYDPATELLGSRTAESKTFVQPDGSFIAAVAPVPIHYVDDSGVWQNIDLNLDSTESGWSVTKNTFETYFSEDVRGGLAIVVDDSIDPLRIGIDPMVIMLENETLNPMPFNEMPNPETVKVAGNQIRYPMTMTTELEYTVSTTQVKQNLNLREAPFVPEGFEGWFGLQETMVLPPAHALFIGESMVPDDTTVTTNQSLDVRHIETGALLVSIAAPQIHELGADVEPVTDPYLGMYVIRVYGEVVSITTVVDTAWLLDENRTFPVVIDPTVDAGVQRTGYAYYYRYTSWWGTTTYERAYSYNNWNGLATCKGTGSYTQACTSSSSYNWYYRWTWYRYDMTAKLPTGATVTDVDFKTYVGRYRSGSRSFEVSVIKSGTAQTSNMIDASSYLGSYGLNLARYIRQSPASSSATTLSDPNYYWYGMSARTISMNSDGIDDVQDAVDGNGAGTSGNILSMSVRVAGTRAPFWYWCGVNVYSYCNSQSELPYLHITYTGGSDTTPPIATFTKYSGTSYRPDSRTMYIGLMDASGVDTTASGGPRLYYAVNNGTWASSTASGIGTCLAGVKCNFKATIPAVSLEDHVSYFWAYQDTPASGNKNMGTTPAGGTGTPSSITAAPSSPYTYFVQDIEKATDGDKKMQLMMKDQSNYNWNLARTWFDYQITMWETNREYVIELDVSNCGTGSNSCFKTSSLEWDLRYSGTRWAAYGNGNIIGRADVPGLTFSADKGPGSNLMYYYDSAAGEFGVMGLGGSSLGIDTPVSAGGSATTLSAPTVGNLDDGYVRFHVPDDFTGYFGALPINGSYSSSSSTRNKICMGTNGYAIFVRSNAANGPYCSTWYLYVQYGYNGFGLGQSDVRVASSGWGGVIAKATNIRPTPDTFPPEFDFSPLMDSYIEDARTVSVTISDAGDPPSGLNTSSGTDATGNLIRPSITYRTYDDPTSTWSGVTELALVPPSGSSLSDCELNSCAWTAQIPGTDRGNSVEYWIHARDKEGNTASTSTTSYTLATPTKVFVVEWHDMNCGFGQQYKCSWQIRLYDTTNEIEFEYDTTSNAYYDYQAIAYQSPTATSGAEIRGRGPGYLAGANPFANNYRIATDGSTHGYETYTAGMSELYNYETEFTGNSNGYPYTYYCTRYWSSYRADCSTVIDLPAGFDFDYFGNTYSGDSGHKIHAIRHGAMQFSTSTSSNSAQMMYYGWGSTMPTMPSSGSYVNNVDLAPWWGYYSAYYCYYNNANECSIRSKVVPFDGAGWDVTSDLTEDTIWDMELSPIRIVPPSGQDYINTGDFDLTIDAGVEVQIMSGKGLAITGPCSTLTVNGNATHPVKFTNLGATRAKGVAFTNGGCTSANTDERHTIEHANFENMDIAISAGSKHGNSPHYNGNVGNFSMSDVAFTNVSKAIAHGSGGGTNIAMTNFAISNASEACMDLPEDSVVELRHGSMDLCNTNNEWWGGGVVAWPGSTGGSLIMENVGINNTRANGVSVDYAALEMVNVSLLNPDIAGIQEVCAQGSTTNCADGAIHHDASGSSGSTLVLDNVQISNYSDTVYTQATDSYSITGVTATGMGGFIAAIPGGAGSAINGPDGDNAVIASVSIEGSSSWKSELYLERTAPNKIEAYTVTGGGGDHGIYLSGSSPVVDTIHIAGFSGSDLQVQGCGWRVNMVSPAITTDGTAIVSNCGQSTSGNTITTSGMTAAYSGSTDSAFYARNTILTVGGATVDANYASIGAAAQNGDLRLVGVTYGSTDCSPAGGFVGLATCPVDALHSSAAIYVGGMGSVGVFRVMNLAPTFVANHRVTTSLADTSGSTAVELLTVGSTMTDGAGVADAWLITDKIERVSGASVVTTSYADHIFNIAGGAGQNLTTPDDPWYTQDFLPDPNGIGHDLPLTVGSHADFKLEAFPEMWNGSTKDCAWFNTNLSGATTDGYYLYTMRIITLATDLVLDNCKLHLNGTRVMVETTSTNAPVITIRNGGELLITGGVQAGGEVGHIRAVSSVDPWTMNIGNSGSLVMDHGYLKNMAPDSSTGTSFLIGDGATLEMRNGSYILGSSTTDPDMATVKVAGGTLLTSTGDFGSARISNVGQTGTGLWLEATSSSNLQGVTVENAGTGIKLHNSAPSVDGYTLSNNDVGIDVYGSMSLPTIYRSTILSGESGWKTYEIDISSFAKENDVLQLGFNSVYNGGDANPAVNSFAYRDYMIYDRIRLAVDMGDGNGLLNVSATHPAAMNTDSDAAHAEAAVWDCNTYGYQYNPGGSYQYAYYGYMLNPGYAVNGNTALFSMNSSYNTPPLNFGFRINSVPGIPNGQNYYPMHFWADYWPSVYYPNRYPDSPDSTGGMWGYYGVCSDYVYRYGAPSTTGYRVEYPPVDTSNSNIVSAKAYVDVFHDGADYYQDRFEFVMRAGGDLDGARAAPFGREFGLAQFDDGNIIGSRIGILSSGARAAAQFNGVNIYDPADDGVLLDGSTNLELNGLMVQNGRYGIRTTSSTSGTLGGSGVALWNQSQDGLVLGKGMTMGLSGQIGGADGAAINILSSSNSDWNLKGIGVNDSATGILTAGSGQVTTKDMVLTGNTVDAEITGIGGIRFIEGEVDQAKVTVTGSGMFERGRNLDLAIESGGSARAGAPVKMLNADGRSVATGDSDGAGNLVGLEFITWTKDAASGHQVMNLAGFRVLSMAKIEYTTSNKEFRYADQALTLSDMPGNQATIDLVNRIEHRVCYGYSSGSYKMMQSCSSTAPGGQLSSSGSRSVPSGAGTMMEYGYSQGMGGSFENTSVMFDTPWTYLTGSMNSTFNNSVLFVTGGYNSLANIYVSYPYEKSIFMHDGQVATLMPDTSNGGFRLGYSGSYNYGGLNIHNSDLIGMASWGTGKGYYGDAPEVRFTNNTVTHHRIAAKSSSTYYEDICTSTSGVHNAVISGNTMYDCGVGFFLPNNYYATSTYYGAAKGTDFLTVKDNTIIDAMNLGIWFYLNTRADEANVEGNTITGGTIPTYGVYTQDATTYGLNITGNSIHAENPIYMRGAVEWNITDNTIIGIQSAARAGIYTRLGHGLISGNDLIDADGGINVYGVYSVRPTTANPYPTRYSTDINDNTIRFSAGRTPTSAAGITVESCGSTPTPTGTEALWINTSGNDIEVITNALTTNNCRVHDSGSTFTSLGGAAGRVHRVDIMAATYTPQNITINEGDTVRWVAVQYNQGANYIHTTTSDFGSSETWDSGNMNLGSAFTYMFNTAGTYSYHCTNHADMTGNITVVVGSSQGLSSTGINVAGGDDRLEMDGTVVSGFGVGVMQSGGELDISGYSLIIADTVGVDAYDVDYTGDGANVEVDTDYGIALNIESPAGMTGGRNVLDIANTNVSGNIGLLAANHREFRWNGGDSSAGTTLQTLGAAAGTIENMTWASTGVQINAGPFSVITSIGNGLLDADKMVVNATAVVHEGNLLDLTVTHMGGAAENVGLVVRSKESIVIPAYNINLSGSSRSEYVSASWRTKTGAEGTGINADRDLSDWYGDYTENIADDMMPGQVAKNHASVPPGDMKITWDDDNLYIAFTGVTFSATDGLLYLDTRPGGSTSGDTWYVSHNIPFMADFLLYAEDWTTWGIRAVNPTGTWIDTTSTCTGLDSAVAYGYPGVTPTWDFDSEFIIPWDCLGEPTTEVRWLAIVQNETNGGVLGAYPPANVLFISIDDPTSGQTFFDFGTFNLKNSDDLATGELDDFVLIYRTWLATGPSQARDYEIIVKVDDGDGYWDWNNHENLEMDQNREVIIDIKRAKPVIDVSASGLVDQTVAEDSGMTAISLTGFVQDHQTSQADMTWEVVDDTENNHAHATPYTYTLNGHALQVTTLTDQFGGHLLEVTVTDEHGLNNSVEIYYNVTNVNDAPVICNPDRINNPVDTCLPIFWDPTVDGIQYLNVRDEKAIDGAAAWSIPRTLGTAANVSGNDDPTNPVQSSYIRDMQNEQDQSDNNPFYVSNGQTYTWTGEFASNSTDCVAFTMTVADRAILLQENGSNEKGGTCWFILGLSDGVDDAADFPMSFTVNPKNDEPVIPEFSDPTDANTPVTKYVEVQNGTKEFDWTWIVMEDDVNEDNLTFDISRMMSDPDHELGELTWAVGAAATCKYERYFSITVDNVNEKLILDLIPDATTDAPTSEIDYLQDADNDGQTDNGVHQMQPDSGVECLVYLFLNDTLDAPSHTDYNQSGYDTYGLRSIREDVMIRVRNTPEARPDYTFDLQFGYDFLNIKAVLPGTRVPFDVIVENNGDPMAEYNYEHDLHVLFYTDDNPGVVQQRVVIQAADMLDTGDDKKVRGWVTLNSGTTEIRSFAEVMTIHPYTGNYIDDQQRRPALEELNWDDNNMTTTDTNQTLPQMVGMRSATSVASFLPSLMTVSLVGMFVGLNILAGRRREDDEEFVASIVEDERAVSPVIATILLVAITVTLSGVIYVWADSLAQTDTKASPRLTAIVEADTDGEQQNWAWRIEITQHQNLLATQAVKVTVEYENASGQQVYEVMLTDKYGPSGFDQNTSQYGVYGRLPSNSDATVTFKDNIDCGQGADCRTGYGSSDIIYIRMHEEDGTKIDRALITVFYTPPGQAATPLMSYVGTYNPSDIKPA